MILIIILLIINFIVRAYTFDYPLVANSGEGIRDYFGGHQIISHGEFPLLGPWSGTTSNFIKNSPVYYYIIAFFLAFRDDVVFLGLVNIFFQCLIIVLIFILSKAAFGAPKALSAAALYSFSPEILRHSEYIWQPYFMIPFAMLSYTLLFFAYKKNNYFLLLLALFSLLVAGAIHNSAYGILPIFLILVFILLRKQHRHLPHYLGVFLLSVGSLLVFYAPAFLFVTKSVPEFISSNNSLVQSPLDYLANIQEGILNLLLVFFFTPTQALVSLSNTLLIVVTISVFIYFTVLKKVKKEKVFTAILVYTLAWQILLASVFTFAPSNTARLIPILGLFPIFLSEVILSVFSKNLFLKFLGILVIILLIKTFSADLRFLKIGRPYENFRIIKEVTSSLDKEISALLKNGSSLSEIGFHSLSPGSYRVFNGVLLIPLEKKFGWEFVKNNKINRFQPSDVRKYVFLACYDHGIHYNRENCIGDFLRNYKYLYKIEKEIFSQYSLTIYLTKRK